MKKNGLWILLLIFCLMFFLNIMTPLIADDYLSTFVLPEGFSTNGIFPEKMEKVATFQDFFNNLKTYYMRWGGRVPGGMPVGIFVLIGKEYFNPVNSFMAVMLIMEIYWLSHEGKISLKFNKSYLIWTFFALWTFNIVFFDTFLWLGGSCNYLWMLVVVLAFLIPYVHNYYSQNMLVKDTTKFTTGMFFLGVLAGWSHETTTCWIILVLFYWLRVCKKNKTLQRWKISGFVGLCIGYGFLIFAPGNFSRFQLERHTSSFVSSELLHLKLLETAFIIMVHFILWYFLLKFFMIHKKSFKETLVKPYLIFAKASTFIAFGSVFMMSLFSAAAMRPSFLTLVFLIIGVASLFRIQEKTNNYLITNNLKALCKFIGYTYLVVTVSVSMCNAVLSRKQLNDILETVRMEKLISSNEILKVRPRSIGNDAYWFIGSGFFHLIGLPITEDENHFNNRTFSKYYDIRGIKIISDSER